MKKACEIVFYLLLGLMIGTASIMVVGWIIALIVYLLGGK